MVVYNSIRTSILYFTLDIHCKIPFTATSSSAPRIMAVLSEIDRAGDDGTAFKESIQIYD